jgi:hypothetical protein
MQLGVTVMLVTAAAAVMSAAGSSTGPSSPPANAQIMTSFTGVFSMAADEIFVGGVRTVSHEDILIVPVGNSTVYFTVHNLDDFVTEVLASGEDSVTISSAAVADSEMWITAGAVVTVQPSSSSVGAGGRARRATAAGPLSVLAILCQHDVANGGDFPTNLPDAATLSNFVFGATGHTTKAQMEACANNAVTFNMATNPAGSTAVVGGVLHVVVDEDMSAMSFGASVTLAKDAANPLLNGNDPDTLYDLVMVFQPGGNFAGTASVPGTFSRYRGVATTSISTHLHVCLPPFRSPPTLIPCLPFPRIHTVPICSCVRRSVSQWPSLTVIARIRRESDPFRKLGIISDLGTRTRTMWSTETRLVLWGTLDSPPVRLPACLPLSSSLVSLRGLPFSVRDVWLVGWL